MRILIAFLLFLTVTFSASALQESVSISTDFRIREVAYDKNEVYKFTAHYGFQSSIEFEQGEDIQTISVGDSVAWQIVPSGNRLFIKPIDDDPDTNMTVVTNRRIYYFQLHGAVARDVTDPSMIFAMRFVYPGQLSVQNVSNGNNVPEEDILENPQKYNFNYTISGPKKTAPIRIFDDGEFTFFQFRDINADIPAFFVVDSESKEAIINYRTVGDYIVVERVSSMFTLRHGSDIVCVFNESNPMKFKPEVQEEKDYLRDYESEEF